MVSQSRERRAGLWTILFPRIRCSLNGSQAVRAIGEHMTIRGSTAWIWRCTVSGEKRDQRAAEERCRMLVDAYTDAFRETPLMGLIIAPDLINYANRSRPRDSAPTAWAI